MTDCLELIVFCDEVIDELRHFRKGLIVSEENLAIETIDQVGPGGSYLEHAHTLRNFRKIWYPIPCETEIALRHGRKPVG